ncbi:sialate O-acetylesterase [Iocasia frigidifontis]|uniref:Sialate O-acetylesterase n=1 Tax=Iocasia fonsfrigidae TaxID=2682810 RepID=A0A8A7KH10_9FIRM|nr:sialate O-acetylesterase [Iocasia fonsfrigidae]QTL99038.1 sialate O-acetylesterase [Iocasia fonsfrigidae]
MKVIKLPRILSDGMVLQRDKEIKIWGWAAKGERITVLFQDKEYSTVAKNNNTWDFILPPMPAGGPYKMIIDGCNNSITINNILIGDVWVCSGQSNMEIPISRVRDLYEEELSTAWNSEIRQFNVPQIYNFNVPCQDLESGEWKSVDPENILDFSAVAYFFAKELYDRYQVPIGLMNVSVGGSPVEAWLSEDALQGFPGYLESVEKFKDDEYVKGILQKDELAEENWYSNLLEKDQGFLNQRKAWYDSDYDDSEWSTFNLPAFFEELGLDNFNGAIWLRKEVEVPASMLNRSARLLLGRIIDSDTAYINGIVVGKTEYQYPPRKYDIPEGLLKEGKNYIAIRVVCNNGQGGFVEDKPYKITAGEEMIDLKGEWRYKVGAVCESKPETTFVQWKPLGLFNGMIAPLLSYTIKGVIWYQGESNDLRPEEYRDLFSSLISDWRQKWKQGIFPFLYVQLPNYGQNVDYSAESNWAVIREAQLKALSVSNTAMVVTIDIGEWNDLHPLNKKDVGIRLALAARFRVYGEEDIVYSGPIYSSMKVEGKKIILTFDHIGSGLTAKGDGKLKTFFLVDSNNKPHKTEAEIRNDKVIVWNEKVKDPVAVYYAWSDNPEHANLYNKEGLPASPFRTGELCRK